MKAPLRARGWPLVTIGHMWTQESPGVWKRHLIRRFEDTGKLDFTEVVHIEQDDHFTQAFCLRCLAQTVREVRHYDWVWYHCESCEFEYRIE